jgi:hypothetical protein
VCTALLWTQLIFSVLILFGAGLLRDFWWGSRRSAALEQPSH